MSDNPAGDRGMDAAAEPVVEDASLASMGEPQAADVMGAAAAAPGPHQMSEPQPAAEFEGAEEYPDMEPLAGPAGGGQGAQAFAAQRHGDGYLRLLIEVEDSEPRVVDASVVEGPLVQVDDLTGEMAYEVLVGERRVAADAFDDLAREHVYPPPDDPTAAHQSRTASRFQFNVRIPRSEVTMHELADVEITLVRPRQTTQLAAHAAIAPGKPLEAAALEAGDEPPEVVFRLRGVDLDSLPPPAAQAVRERLR